MDQPRSVQFRPSTAAAEVLHTWWEQLQGQDPDSKAGPRRGDRAELRHCADLSSVVFTAAYQRLHSRLQQIAHIRASAISEEGLATVAAVLARVRKDRQSKGFAGQMAESKTNTGGPPRVSELRFRRLVQIRDQEELFRALIRIVGMFGTQPAADVLSLAQGAYWWNDRTRKDWAYGYYGTTMQSETD